jgi:hypothetical protein
LYICPGPAHGGCSGTAITAEHAEDAIRDMVLARLDGPDVLGGEVDGRDVAQQLGAYREQLQDLSDLWASGELSREEWLSLKRNVGEARGLWPCPSSEMAWHEHRRTTGNTPRSA